MITDLPVAELGSAALQSAPLTAQFPEEQVDGLVHLFKLLADDTRMRILLYLSRKREMHVRELCKQLDQSQPAVSHHLALLRAAKLIKMRREGRHNFYRLQPRRVERMAKLFRSVLQTRDAQAKGNGRHMEYVAL